MFDFIINRITKDVSIEQMITCSTTALGMWNCVFLSLCLLSKKCAVQARICMVEFAPVKSFKHYGISEFRRACSDSATSSFCSTKKLFE